MSSATLTSKGQITIPKEVRNSLGIDTGDRVEFIEIEPNVYSMVAATSDIKELKGIIPQPNTPVSLQSMEKAIRKRASNKR